MKSLSFMIFGLCLVLVFSCKKDDPQELILGKWKIASAELRGCDDPSNNEKMVYNNGCLSEFGYTSCHEFNFKADKSLTITNTEKEDGSNDTDTETTEGTYEIDGNNLTFCLDINDCYSGTFTVSENSLSMIDFIEDIDNCSSELIYKK